MKRHFYTVVFIALVLVCLWFDEKLMASTAVIGFALGRLHRWYSERRARTT